MPKHPPHRQFIWKTKSFLIKCLFFRLLSWKVIKLKITTLVFGRCRSRQPTEPELIQKTCTPIHTIPNTIHWQRNEERWNGGDVSEWVDAYLRCHFTKLHGISWMCVCFSSFRLITWQANLCHKLDDFLKESQQQHHMACVCVHHF